jgi:hypothetical protein
VALNSHALPARERSAAELHAWVRRDEEYAILGANVVVELNSESRAANRPAEPGRSPDGPTATSGWPASAPAGPNTATPAGPAAPTTHNPTKEDGCRRPLIPTSPTGPDSDQRLDAVQVPWAHPSRERTPLT